MFKVHVIDAANRAEYQAPLEQHHRIRHDIYVGERRWMALARPDGREVDQFDTEAATYLLGIDPQAGVVAGSRLVPTLRPHLMSEVFPQLADVRGLPRADDIWEWTRIFVVPARREDGRLCQAAGIMYCALLEWALARRIQQLSVVCEAYWVPRLAMLDWSPRPLGEAIAVDGMAVVGITVDMTPRALATTRARYGIAPGVLHEPARSVRHAVPACASSRRTGALAASAPPRRAGQA